MGLLMVQDLLEEDAPVRKRIVDAGYRLVSERQPFAAAGKFPVIVPCRLAERAQIVGAHRDQNRADLRHAVVEFRQRIKQRRLLVIVLQNAAFAVVELPILGKRRGVAGPQLAERRVQQLPPARRSGLQDL